MYFGTQCENCKGQLTLFYIYPNIGWLFVNFFDFRMKVETIICRLFSFLDYCYHLKLKILVHSSGIIINIQYVTYLMLFKLFGFSKCL